MSSTKGQPEKAPEEADVQAEESLVQALGFSIDTGRARASQIDPVKLEALMKEAEEAMQVLSEKLGRPVNSVVIPLATFNKKMGTNSHNAHSTVYNIVDGKVTQPILKQHNMKLGRRGKYNAAVKDQGIAFISVEQ